MKIIRKNQNTKQNFYGESIDIDIDGVVMDGTFKVKKIISKSRYDHSGPTLDDLKNSRLSGSSCDTTFKMDYKLHYM